MRSSELTQVLDAVTGLVQGSGVEFQADNGEDDDGKQHQQADLEQWSHGFDDGFEHHLQTWKQTPHIELDRASLGLGQGVAVESFRSRFRTICANLNTALEAQNVENATILQATCIGN